MDALFKRSRVQLHFHSALAVFIMVLTFNVGSANPKIPSDRKLYCTNKSNQTLPVVIYDRFN